VQDKKKENLRKFIQVIFYSLSALFTFGLYRYFRPTSVNNADVTPEKIYDNRKLYLAKSIDESFEVEKTAAEQLTEYKHIINYNNFYEFSTDKASVAKEAANWKINDWILEIDGLVERPLRLNLIDIYKIELEERIYRFRCVEGWAMVIPWLGFPLAKLIEKTRPLPKAQFVAFESYFNETVMPNAKYAGISFPYIEGLRIDEALNPLTFLATGLYKKNLLNQNGAPIRLVVPWKYGFKSIKSITKIKLVEQQPQTTWSLANPSEYGFYSNVNPNVDHPRWSQKRERLIGQTGLQDTLMFNGYEKQVEKMYNDLDLTKYF